MSKKTNFTLKDGELFGPLEAGRLLGVGPDSIKYFERIGKLPCVRTASGNRIVFAAGFGKTPPSFDKLDRKDMEVSK